MAGKRLNATITIGGGVGRTLTKGLTSTKKRLGDVGDSIRTVEKRQKTLGKSIDTFGRMGKNVDGMRREYGSLTDEVDRLRRKQQQLLKVEKARARVSGAYSKFTGQVGKSVRTLRNASFAAAGVGTAVVGLASKVAASGDEIAKTARAIEFNTSAFQEYQFAAERVGVSQGTFNQSLQAFGKRLGELKTRGTGALATQLKEMNPALYETLKTTESTQEAFEIYTQAMREATDASERNAMASAGFSRAGLKMGLMAQTSSEEIQRLRERAEELGYVLGEDDLQAAEKFTDEMTNMQTAMGGVGRLIGAELMPVLSKFFKRFTGFVVENRDKISGWAKTIAEKTEGALPSIVKAAQGIGSTLMAVGQLTNKLADLVGGFDNLAIGLAALKFSPVALSAISLGKELGLLGAKYLPSVAAGIKTVGAALLTNPIGIAAVAIGAAALAIYTYWEPIKGFFSRLWEGVKGIFSGGIDTIKSVLSWTPLGLITSNWGGITDFIGGLWDNVTAMTQKALDWVSSKLEWVGGAIKKLGGWFGFGGDDEDEGKARQAAPAASEPGSAGKPGDVVRFPTERARPPGPPPHTMPGGRGSSKSVTNNLIRNGDVVLNISMQPGEDPNALARRVMAIIRQDERGQSGGELYDLPTDA